MFDEDRHSYEDALRFYAQIRLPENKRDAFEKQAADMSFVIPGLLGMGAAGTAGYMGMREGRNQAKIEALKNIKDPRKREIAMAETESNSVKKYFPAALGAGVGTAYLLGSHTPENLIAATTDAEGKAIARKSLKDLKWHKKLLHGPGTGVQRGLRALGATSNVGRAIAGTAALGAGIFTGSQLGKRDARRIRAELEKKSMLKQAGLFMRPSDVADSHHDLSAALESRLNNSPGGGEFKKHANSNNNRAASMAAGAAIGATYSTLRRELTDPVEPPPVEEVKGVGNRIRRTIHKAHYKGDQFSRKHPVASTILSAGAGAGAAYATGLGSGARALNKTRKGQV